MVTPSQQISVELVAVKIDGFLASFCVEVFMWIATHGTGTVCHVSGAKDLPSPRWPSHSK